jgi:hypothetical protein
VPYISHLRCGMDHHISARGHITTSKLRVYHSAMPRGLIGEAGFPPAFGTPPTPREPTSQKRDVGHPFSWRCAKMWATRPTVHEMAIGIQFQFIDRRLVEHEKDRHSCCSA